MEKNQIHRLLEKYFEGSTTLEEEKALRDFFSVSGDDNPDLLPLKRQFEIFSAGQSLSFNTLDLESGIIKSIEDFEQKQIPPVRKPGITRYLVAASIAIAVLLSGIFILKSQNKQIRDTYTDPQIAYAETQKALLLISQKMNEGMQPLTNITKINSGNEQLKKLEKMDKSLEMLNLVSFINQSSNLKK
ncbi:MAG TPA: hypothetical protein VHI78_00520 [Bacteroidales bacterium]|jgi:hypothetical protein|nr:hypothetical protein [Bacteroidales bacterium]